MNQPKYRSPSDPSNMVSDEPEARPEKKHRPRRDHRQTRAEVIQAEKNVRPDDVSERVWNLAEQWLELGEAHFGKRLKVNKQKFASRLSEKINGEKELRKWMAAPKENWDPYRWDDGMHFVMDIVARMMQMFFEYLTPEQKNTPALQWDFLEDEWDEWVYHATTSVKVAEYQAHGNWVKPKIRATLDRSTIGRPDPEEPHPDPEYAGMTRAEVDALDEQDVFEQPSDEPEPPRSSERMASIKRAIVANRDHHQEPTDDTDA